MLAQEKCTTCNTSINLASASSLFQITSESLVNHLVEQMGKLFPESQGGGLHHLRYAHFQACQIVGLCTVYEAHVYMHHIPLHK